MLVQHFQKLEVAANQESPAACVAASPVQSFAQLPGGTIGFTMQRQQHK